MALTQNGYNWLGVGISNKHNTKGTELFGTVRLKALRPKGVLLLDFPELVSYFVEVVKCNITPSLGRKIKKDNGETLEGSSSQDIDENTEPPEDTLLPGSEDRT